MSCVLVYVHKTKTDACEIYYHSEAHLLRSLLLAAVPMWWPAAANVELWWGL